MRAMTSSSVIDGEAVADQSFVGLDLDEAGGQRGRSVHPHDVDLERNVQWGGGDAGDLHDRTSGWRGQRIRCYYQWRKLPGNLAPYIWAAIGDR